jgi:hypothetical protein
VASIGALKFEAIQKGKFKKLWSPRWPPQLKGKHFMNLSVETKVAIAVATSFVVLMMGAMAQG